MSNPEPGFKTTEFLTTIVTMASIAGGLVPPQYTTVVAAIGGVYIAARTLLKAVHALGYADKIPDLPTLPNQGETK